MAGAARGVEEEDGVVDLEAARVGDPAAVGRPAELEALEAGVQHPAPAVHLLRGSGLQIVDADGLGVVDEGDLRAVRRPEGPVAEARAERGHGAGVPAARGDQLQLVLAPGVAPHRDVRAVGRPCGEALGGARCAAQVEDHSVPGRHREDLAAGLEDGALAGGRDVRPLDEVGGVDLPRPDPGEIGDQVDLHLDGALVLEPHPVQPAAGLEDHVGGSDRGEGDVELLEPGHLPELTARHVQGPDVGAQLGAAVGQEVEGVAVPHGVGVVGVARRQVARLHGLEVEEPDVRCSAAAVAFPGSESAVLRGEGDAAAVGREGAVLAVGHG